MIDIARLEELVTHTYRNLVHISRKELEALLEERKLLIGVLAYTQGALFSSEDPWLQEARAVIKQALDKCEGPL